MSYDIIQQKLNNNNLTYDELLEMSVFLRFDETKTDNAYVTLQIFFSYIIKNYDGSVKEINDLIIDIVDLKDYKYFDTPKPVFAGFSANHIKKKSYFLDIYYKHCAKKCLSFNDKHINIMFYNIDDWINHLNMLTSYSYRIIRISEEKTVDMIIKYGNLKIYNHFFNCIQSLPLKTKLEDVIKNINIISNKLTNTVDSKFIQIKDGKYNNYDIMLLFAFNKMQDIINIMSDLKNISDDFLLDLPIFVLLLKNCAFNIIENFLTNGKMKESDKEKCFDYFFEYMVLFEILPAGVENIYKKILSKKNIIPTQEHMNLFFQKESYELISFLKLYYKLDLNLNYNSYKSFVSESRYKNDNEKIEMYFENIIMTQQHLEYACLNNNKNMIVYILNNKVIPTKKCYEIITINTKCTSDEKVSIIDLFVQFGYQITNDDIILAKTHYLKLDESKYAKKFLPNKEENNNTNNKIDALDVKDVKTMCKTITRAIDFTRIKTLIKKTKVNLDDECIEILRKSYIKSKVKDELIASAIVK